MASTFISTCPRCATKDTTFDVLSAKVMRGTTDRFYTFSVCRHCDIPSVFELYDRTNNRSPLAQDLVGRSVNFIYDITLSKPVFESLVECPEFVPEPIRDIFAEASRCFAIGAFDASGAMSRKVLDASTRSLLKTEPQSVDKSDPEYISWKEAKDLRLRLDWLFVRNRLPESLKELASCVHQDGNDAAHASETIGRESASDLQDFTVSILETLYTQPGRIAANIQRREARRTPPSAS